MKKRVLFLGTQNIKEQSLNGGMQCSRRNFDLIAEIVDQDDLFSAIIWNSQKKYRQTRFFARCTGSRESLHASVRMCRLYKVSEEKKILDYIKQVDPDILFADTTVLGKILAKINKTCKIVVFMHNVETEYARHRVEKEGTRYLLPYLATAYNERLSVKYADKLICLNNRDSALTDKIYNRRPDHLLPISFKDIFDPKKVRREDCSNVLLFVGSNFGPNYDGIKWFIEEVMQRLESYRLILVGKDFEKAGKELERQNVSVIGTIDHLEDYYYRYFNIVMPIQYGDGMKVKTAEAMMFGMNIFATDEALEGYDVEGIQGIFRCNCADEFVEAITKNAEIEAESLWNQDVRKAYQKKYCFTNQIELMKKILSDW